MKLGEFSRLVDATPKWVQNAAAVLGTSFSYTLAEAQRLSLVRALVATADIPLKRAYAMAELALAQVGDLLAPRAGALVPTHLTLTESPDGAVKLEMDFSRFASGFISRLSATRNSYGERKRGRPAGTHSSRQMQAAADWAADVSLLRDGLRKTAAQRLREMDETSRTLRDQRRRASVVTMLRGLVAAEIRFVVIGGVAAGAHGSSLISHDLDICYDAAEDNVGPLAAVLRAWMSYPRGVEPSLPFIMDERQFRAAPVMTLTTILGDLNLVHEVAGVGDYRAALDASACVPYDDFEFRILSLPALIRANKATGRPKDLAQLPELEALLAIRKTTSGTLDPIGRR